MTEETLFELALNTPTADRATLLDRECAGDPDLRTRVEALLAARQVLESLARREPAPASPTPPGEAPPPAPGETTAPLDGRPAEGVGSLLAGKYKLVEQIGEGGMGAVFMAQQTAPVRRAVAVKVIKAGMDTRAVLARFDAERQALALMDHPNIARVLDAGTTDSGRPFFVMELVNGTPITRFCDQRRLTPRERLKLFVPVCQAIQHAHQKGVIHRDLKPSNVLVALYDDRPVPKVIDFGVAKATGPQLTEQTLMTGFGDVVGTPEYMSPEQATLNSLDIDTRSDVYALGVLLYELLTGTTPVDRRSLGQAAVLEILRIVREVEPPAPSSRLSTLAALPSIAANRSVEPARLAAMLRGELDWIVMKALEKDRSRRYETANALARDVQRYLADETVEASPPSTAYRLRKFLRRHRGPVLAVSTIFLLLVGGIVGTTIGLVQAQKARQSESNRAQGERQAKETAERRLDQIEKGIAILGSIFEDLDPRAEEKEGRPLRAILADRLDRAAAQLDGEAIADPLVVAKLQDRLGRTCLGLGHTVPAESLFTKALATRKAHLGADHPLTLASMHNQALAFDSAGRPAEAIALLERVRDTRTKTLGGEHPDALNAQNDLALMYLRAGRRDEAVALLERVRDVRAVRLGGDHALTLAALESLAQAYVGVWRGKEAIELLERVRHLRTKELGPDHRDTLRALNTLAFAYQSSGQMKPAIALFEETRDAVVPRLGPDHPQTLNILDNLVRMYRAVGRTKEAIALGEQVRDARVKNLGVYHPHTIHILDNLALAYRDAGKPEQALPLLQQAAAGLEKLAFIHGDSGRIIANLCECLEKSNRPRQADDWRRKWLAAARENYGPESTIYASELEVQGTDLLDRGRHADAAPILRECLSVRRKTQPEDWQTFQAQSLLGAALLGQRAYAEAEPLLVGAYEGLKAREEQIPRFFVRYHLAEAGARIVRLYEAWGRPEEAAAWRSKLKGTSTDRPAPPHSA
jgi:serine/threonine protein kinase/tetratricopeptide (TPR) repeat protein